MSQKSQFAELKLVDIQAHLDMTSKHVKEKQIQPFVNKNCCYQSIQPASKHS